MAEEKKQEANEGEQAKKVAEFHSYDDLDQSFGAHHHSLGAKPTQAAPGDHRHDGTNSLMLFDAMEINGKRSDGTALNALIDALGSIGLINKTTA